MRGWKRGVLRFTRHSLVTADNIADEAMRSFTHNARELLDPDGSVAPHLIEIEFPDEPDPQARFMRFGTDTTMMAEPVAFELPTHCEQCGALLEGGATVHKPGCPWLAVIKRFEAL